MKQRYRRNYYQLLEALAEFCRQDFADKSHLDAFLSGYAGHDWARAKEGQGEQENKERAAAGIK